MSLTATHAIGQLPITHLPHAVTQPDVRAALSNAFPGASDRAPVDFSLIFTMDLTEEAPASGFMSDDMVDLQDSDETVTKSAETPQEPLLEPMDHERQDSMSGDIHDDQQRDQVVPSQQTGQGMGPLVITPLGDLHLRVVSSDHPGDQDAGVSSVGATGISVASLLRHAPSWGPVLPLPDGERPRDPVLQGPTRTRDAVQAPVNGTHSDPATTAIQSPDRPLRLIAPSDSMAAPRERIAQGDVFLSAQREQKVLPYHATETLADPSPNSNHASEPEVGLPRKSIMSGTATPNGLMLREALQNPVKPSNAELSPPVQTGVVSLSALTLASQKELPASPRVDGNGGGVPPVVQIAGALFVTPTRAITQANLFPLESTRSAEMDTPSQDNLGLLIAAPSSTSLLPEVLHTRPENPRPVLQQLLDASVRAIERPVDLHLNPEELGRVRISITMSDGVITMTVLAERSETLDLMRRHSDQLAQELRQLGYGTINFSFGQREGGKDERTDSQPSESLSDLPEPTVAVLPRYEPKLHESGLDIRV